MFSTGDCCPTKGPSTYYIKQIKRVKGCVLVSLHVLTSTPCSFNKVSSSSSLASLAADFDALNFSWASVKPFGILNHCVMPRHGKPTSGKVLAHAKNQIQSFREQMGVRVCVFKVGITCNPIQRFISYREVGFTDMWVVTMCDSVDSISMLEAACIALFSAHVGCRNKAETGGEGALNRSPPPKPPFFLYVTGGRADQLRKVG